MSEQDQKESQKTIVAFIAGLLVGGLLVWVFTAGPSDEAATTTDMNENESEVSDTIDDVDTMDENDDDTSSDTDVDTSADTSTNSTMDVGDAELVVEDQAAGSVVILESAVFPNSEGWIGIRDYQDGELGNILGVARFSEEQGLIPTEVDLLRATQPGETYAAVYFTESGDREFSLANDSQIDAVVEVFTAE